MSLLVAITGVSGFLASYALFRLGLVGMGARYAATVLVAYAVFLQLLWLWLRRVAREYEALADRADLVPANAVSISGAVTPPPRKPSDSSGVVSDLVDGGLEFVGEAEALAIPIAALALLAGLVVSVVFIVSSAPVLFAELIVDGVLAASLYRRLRGLEPSHWLRPALRHTFWPFVLTMVLAGLGGHVLERHAPGAHTLAQALHPALRDPD